MIINETLLLIFKLLSHFCAKAALGEHQCPVRLI